jgi:hypothetical protein
MGSESNPDPEPIPPSPLNGLTLKLHAATTKKENATTGPTTTESATGEPQQPSTPSRDSDVEVVEPPHLASPFTFTLNPTMRPPGRTTRNQPSPRPDEEDSYNEPAAGLGCGRSRNHADADPPAVLEARDNALPNAAVPTPLNRRLRDTASRQGAGWIDLRGIDPVCVRGRVPALRGASRSDSVDARAVEPRQRRAAGRAARGGSHGGAVGLDAVVVDEDGDVDMDAAAMTAAEGGEKVEDGGRYQSRYQIDPEDFTVFSKMLAHVPEDANSVYVPSDAEFASMLLNAPVSIDVDGEPRALDEVSWSEERAEVEYLADYLEAKYQTDPGALKKPMAE